MCLIRLGLTPDPGPESASAIRATAVRQTTRFFGDYELQRELARGGMGVVYEARQMSLNRPVALKMILAGHLATPASVQRFRLEAEAAARLDHPNIVPIYEIGEHQGQHFYSMKLLMGGSLAKNFSTLALPREGLAPTEFWARQCAIARTVVKIAKAVDFAHKHGVLHRDLKPTNILLDAQGEPHVSDFGLAKVTESEEGLTLSGTPLGTPGYMAPEQAAGLSKRLTTAADVYSLGALLYELLTGRPPFVGSTPLTTMKKVLEEVAVAPRVLNVQINRDLETICLKCLSKEPESRYPSALAFAQDLEHWLAGEPIAARPVGMFEKLWSRARRDPKLAALVVVVLVSLLLVAVGSSIAALRIRRAEQARREDLYQAYLAQARAERLSGQAGQRFASLDALAKAARIRRSTELSDEAASALALPDLRAASQWGIGSRSSGDNLRFDDGLERYAEKTRAGISIRTVGQGRETLFLPVGDVGGDAVERVWVYGFDHPGRHLAAVCKPDKKPLHCRVWDLRDNGALVFDTPAELCALSPGGRVVAVETNGTVSIYQLGSTQALSQFSLGWRFRGPYGGFQVSPDGTRLATYADGAATAEIWELASGQLLTSLTHTNPIAGLAWNHRADTIAIGYANGEIAIWDPNTDRVRLRMQGHNNRTTGFGFAHSEEMLASTGWDGTMRLWDLTSGRQVLLRVGEGVDLRFSPDDRFLAGAVEGLNCELLEVAHATGCQELSHPPSSAEAWCLDFTPDGRLLVASCAEGLRFWDIFAGREMGLVPMPSTRSVRFREQGELRLLGCYLPGLYEWPIHIAADRVRLGPPLVSQTRQYLGSSSLGARGKKLIVERSQRDRALIIDLDAPTNVLALGPHGGCAFVGLDPLGRWAATATWKGTGVKIWNPTTGNLLRDLPVEGSANVSFSPDGNWLATVNAEGCRLWKTGSWMPSSQSVPRDPAFLTSALAFSPDSRLLAVVYSGSDIRLVTVPNFAPVATLRSPAGAYLTCLCFSPDGTRLAALEWNQQVHLWDLERIRSDLQKMGLDWHLPAVSAETAQPRVPTPLELDAGPFSREELAAALGPRAPEAGTNLLDLTAYYNAPLTTDWCSREPGNDLSELPQGLQHFAEVDFDVRGVIQVGTRARNELSFPRAVEAIPVRRACRRLHFLQAAVYGDGADGKRIGSYVVHFANGQGAEIPIVMGHDLADWFPKAGETEEYVIAWTGYNPYVRRYNHPIRLFKSTWQNPYPAVPIRSFDFVSKGLKAAPFLVAVTAEP